MHADLDGRHVVSFAGHINFFCSRCSNRKNEANFLKSRKNPLVCSEFSNSKDMSVRSVTKSSFSALQNLWDTNEYIHLTSGRIQILHGLIDITVTVIMVKKKSKHSGETLAGRVHILTVTVVIEAGRRLMWISIHPVKNNCHCRSPQEGAPPSSSYPPICVTFSVLPLPET